MQNMFDSVTYPACVDRIEVNGVVVVSVGESTVAGEFFESADEIVAKFSPFGKKMMPSFARSILLENCFHFINQGWDPV